MMSPAFFFFKTKQTDPWRVYSSTGEAKKKMSFKTVAK